MLGALSVLQHGAFTLLPGATCICKAGLCPVRVQSWVVCWVSRDCFMSCPLGLGPADNYCSGLLGSIGSERAMGMGWLAKFGSRKILQHDSCMQQSVAACSAVLGLHSMHDRVHTLQGMNKTNADHRVAAAACPIIPL